MTIINDGKSRRFGENALSTLLLLIKNKFVSKEYKTGSTSAYKTLSDNDLTDELKTKYEAAYSHSTSAHAPTNAQANIIEAVKVNGADVNIENKTVDIAVPLVSTDISTDKASSTKAASAKAVFDYVSAALAGASSMSFNILEEGQYDASGVPTIEGESNYIYLVPDENSANNVYAEYIFVNGAFECIGKTAVDLDGYLKEEDLVEFSTEEVNAIWSSVFSS